MLRVCRARQRGGGTGIRKCARVCKDLDIHVRARAHARRRMCMYGCESVCMHVKGKELGCSSVRCSHVWAQGTTFIRTQCGKPVRASALQAKQPKAEQQAGTAACGLACARHAVLQVKKDASMLDAFGKGASEDIQRAKDAVYRVRGVAHAHSTAGWQAGVLCWKGALSLPARPAHTQLFWHSKPVNACCWSSCAPALACRCLQDLRTPTPSAQEASQCAIKWQLHACLHQECWTPLIN